VLAIAAAACSAAGTPATPDAARSGGEAAETQPLPPPFGPEVVSLRLKRSIVVRAEPREDAKPIGTVAADTRVSWLSASTGPGCERWIQIHPRGWVCERYLEPTKKPPFAVELPKLRPGELVPGLYGRVAGGGARAYASTPDARAGKVARTIAGAVTVRRLEEVQLGARAFWKTSSGELIEAAKIRAHEPSAFAGIASPVLPMAWAQSRRSMKLDVPVLVEPEAKAPIVRRLTPRTVVAVGGTSADGAFHRIGEGEWVAAADLHVARLVDPPPLTAADEHWIDIDLDEQVLTAYEGTRPIYATLVSTGNRKWPTAEGVYRIWIKFAETDMSGQMGDEQPYSVATVPWTAYFAKDLALHTAYWHDRFGEARSHGCVNLSPADARWLYFWTSPDVPMGWSMAHGIFESPGSIVRIRSRAIPDPPFMGYAKRVHEARLTERLSRPL
jgi:hypothetical protein